jgi:L-asparaginase
VGCNRRIAFIGTGGSISTLGRDSHDLFEYAEFGRTMQVDELLKMFAEDLADYDIAPTTFEAVVSTALGPAQWLLLSRSISEISVSNPRPDGFVITHGTATLEEAAYFLSLTCRVTQPIVIVGAQRPPNSISSDAGINLCNAFQVASSEQARDLGVLVVLNDEIHAAREVTKGTNYRLNAFRTPDFGCLGYVDPDGTVAIYRRPTRRHTAQSEFDPMQVEELPVVEILYSYAGSLGRMVPSMINAGAKGIVNAGLAPGKPTPAERAELTEAARRGVLVVQCSRAGSGRVAHRTRDWEADFVVADNLNPQKARILAMLALAFTSDRNRIRAIFNDY